MSREDFSPDNEQILTNSIPRPCIGWVAHCSTLQDLVQLYVRAVQRGAVVPGGGSAVAGGSSATKDVSKMTPAERKKEIARRRAEAQKEKVRNTCHIYQV